jgi:hydroxymethylbilane synthase
VIRLGTRGSALALAQAELVASLLEDEVEVVPIATSGDRRRERPPAAGGDKAAFVKEIEEALLEDRVDLAVHSAKDVPSELPGGLAIVGVPERADPRDALCGAPALDDLSGGAVVGTGSLRRRAQLLALRPDIDVRPLRGNVDTRLRRLAEGDFDALVLAMAGLERLGRQAEGAPLAPEELIPAPGQGCLALEARTDDERVREAAAAVTERESLSCLTAERAVVDALDASCRTPMGAYAQSLDGGLRLSAFVGLPDGSLWVRDELEGDEEDPAALGQGVAARLLAAGAGEVLQQAASSPA